MNYQELTPMRQSGYDGYMDPTVPEQPRQERAQQEVTPAPLSKAAKSAMNSELVDKEGENESEEADSDKKFREENKELVNAQRTTREHLGALVKKLRNPNANTDILGAAEQVLYAARVLQRNKDKLTKDDLKKIDPDQVVKEAEELVKKIQEKRKMLKRNGDEDAQKAAAKQMQGSVFSNAGNVAQLAEHIGEFFQREKIAPEERDPYKPIISFEELMTKWVDVVENKFRPGEEFALIDVEEQQPDQFGRVLLKETVHPENFLRWVQEKIWFYHDFDPYKPIDLFKNLYLTIGFRTVSVYEMLVDVPTYFYHREETLGDLTVHATDLQNASGKSFRQTYVPKQGQSEYGEIGEKYGEYRIKDDSINEDVTLTVVLSGSDRGQPEYAVRYPTEDENPAFAAKYPELAGRMYQAVLEDKDQWRTVEDPSFDKIKDTMLYQVWILNEAHNHDVAYRQQGMPTETELNKIMAEIYSMNMYTKNRKRLYGMLNMPAVRRKDEIEAFKNDTLKSQGSIGKAVQRSLAAYYHLAESNAAAAGYGGALQEFNPFKKLLEKGDISGSDIFYKSLIRQTLENHFGYEYTELGKQGYKKNKVAVDLWKELNKGRADWEKADLMDIVVLGRSANGNELEKALLSRGITPADFAKAVDSLRKIYQEGNKRLGIDAQPEKVQELDRLLQMTTQQKKQDVFSNLGGPLGEKIRGKSFGKAYDAEYIQKFIDGSGFANLDEFGVKFFALAFDSYGTSNANVFENINYDLVARDRVKQAMRDAIQVTEKLDDFEAKYAEEYAFVMTYITGISARNDMLGIGHDAWSKMINTEFYRLRQSGGGNYLGNIDNLYGIHRLGLNFWEGLTVQAGNGGKLNKTIYEVLVGQYEDEKGNLHFNINKDIEEFDFHGNAMRQFYADHINHVIELFIDITKNHEFNTDKLISEDGRGRIVINHKEVQKFIDVYWKHMRYGFDNRHLLYDNTVYNWWYDEKLKPDGQVSRTPHFGFRTIRDLMFSKEVQSMEMYNRLDVSSWSGLENFATKNGRNVFAYLIKAQIEEHTRNRGDATLYNADQVAILTDALMNISARLMRGEHGEAVVLSGFFSPEEIYRILVAAHAILWQLYAKEYGTDALGGIFAALLQAFSIIMKETGAGISLGK